MFRVKICGITNTADARAAADAGADCIGLNFCAESPRYVEMAQAREIVAAIHGRLLVAGVFVDAPAARVRDAAEQLSLDLVQLSGDEPPERIGELAGWPVMRAMRVGPDGLAAQLAYLAACRRLGCPPRLVLWDAYDAKRHGGTGRKADWPMAARGVASADFPPVILAGGLTPDNVAAAIHAVGPSGVDAASGVESSPGKKDAALVKSFVTAAKAAFDNCLADD